MPVIAYIDKRFNRSTAAIIEIANKIIQEYNEQGFTLTLRSLYYKFIARDLFPQDWVDETYNRAKGLDPQTKNTIKNYKRLGSILNDARLAGRTDWYAFDDITRQVNSLAHWETAAARVKSASETFRVDMWNNQDYRPEIWVEKDAVKGVITGICQELDIPYLCCRGYTSQTEMWGSAMRLQEIIAGGQTPYILHFGDHDPSGIDMTRDIQERLAVFKVEPQFKRMALSKKQVDDYKCPPNPAKETDSRFKEYEKKFGDESWELDALEPKVIVELIRKEVLSVRDEDAWDERKAYQAEQYGQLKYASDNWELIAKAMTKRRKRKGK
jgi:hypothetical protein